MSIERVPWWHDRLEIARLADWLTQMGNQPTDGWGYFIEKPWKWTPEYEQMLDEEREEERDRLREEEAWAAERARYAP